MSTLGGAARTVGPVTRIRDSIERIASRIPYNVKLAIIYLIIFLLGVVVFLGLGLDTRFMEDWTPYILRGLPLTLIICVGSIVLATVLALIGALGRLSHLAIFNGPASFYVSFIRGTPLIVQIFFIYFGLPQLGVAPGAPDWLQPLVTYDVVPSGILALGINYGAYMTEIFRAGIQSVSYGQREAAHALGMSGPQTMRRVVLPQAVRVIIPPTGNEFIAMLKDSALVGLAGTQEVFR